MTEAELEHIKSQPQLFPAAASEQFQVFNCFPLCLVNSGYSNHGYG